MDTQLFLVELKANPSVWRITHTHSYTAQYFTGEKNCFAEAFASINKMGSKIYFGSNWGNYATDYTDTYQVILPEGWPITIPEFPSSLISLLFMIVTLLVVVVHKSRSRKARALDRGFLSMEHIARA